MTAFFLLSFSVLPGWREEEESRKGNKKNPESVQQAGGEKMSFQWRLHFCCGTRSRSSKVSPKRPDSKQRRKACLSWCAFFSSVVSTKIFITLHFKDCFVKVARFFDSGADYNFRDKKNCRRTHLKSFLLSPSIKVLVMEEPFHFVLGCIQTGEVHWFR